MLEPGYRIDVRNFLKSQTWLQEAAEIVALGQKQVLEDSKVPSALKSLWVYISNLRFDREKHPIKNVTYQSKKK